jgi:uncharacterized protein YnzC (UPF0291/DUF896 family)
MSTLTVETETEIWSRTIKPDQGDLSPDAARALLALKLPAVDVQRINELSAKAREGALSAVESALLDNYLNVGRALELLKAKARFSLAKISGLDPVGESNVQHPTEKSGNWEGES